MQGLTRGHCTDSLPDTHYILAAQQLLSLCMNMSQCVAPVAAHAGLLLSNIMCSFGQYTNTKLSHSVLLSAHGCVLLICVASCPTVATTSTSTPTTTSTAAVTTTQHHLLLWRGHLRHPSARAPNAAAGQRAVSVTAATKHPQEAPQKGEAGCPGLSELARAARLAATSGGRRCLRSQPTHGAGLAAIHWSLWQHGHAAGLPG